MEQEAPVQHVGRAFQGVETVALRIRRRTGRELGLDKVHRVAETKSTPPNATSIGAEQGVGLAPGRGWAPPAALVAELPPTDWPYVQHCPTRIWALSDASGKRRGASTSEVA
jgi:hypothetical protein